MVMTAYSPTNPFFGKSFPCKMICLKTSYLKKQKTVIFITNPHTVTAFINIFSLY